MRLLVAGASGMVGRALVDRLAQLDDVHIRATCFSQLIPNSRRNVEFMQVDLRNRTACCSALKGCHAAFMVAAVTGGSAFAQNQPWNQVTDNLVMSAQFLHACHLEGVRRVILVGSATCYPPGNDALTEEALDWNFDPFQPHFGIGWVTRSVEKIARFWHDNTGMEIVLVRAANVFGPYAKFDPATSNFIPALIRKAVERMDPFVVWGSSNVVRDVIYSVDFAQILLGLLQHNEIHFDVFNVGSGCGISVEQAVQWCLKYSCHEPKSITYTSSAPPATRTRIINCSKLQKLLSIHHHVGIEGGIRDTLTWYEQNRTLWNR